jgi:hypothetical protein
LIPDDDGNCAACGRGIALPNLGDMMGIIHLIDATVRLYSQMIASNTDPNDPSQPRMRMVGGVIARVPHKVLYGQFFTPSYREAKELGYRGTLARWSEILEEAAGPQVHPANPVA